MSDVQFLQRARACFAHPATGTTLFVLAALSFVIVCILLPMVGPAGAAAPHAAHNHQVYSIILIVALGFSALSIASKLARRRHDQSPLPWLPIGLCSILAFLLITLHAGLLRI
jgi:hypothetical protein